MGESQIKIISKPNGKQGFKDDKHKNSIQHTQIGIESDFLDKLAEEGNYGDYLRERLKKCLGEVLYLKNENRWDEIISLFYPLEEKLPEIVQSGLANELRLNVSFALGQKKIF